MSEQDRSQWDARWEERGEPGAPSSLLTALDDVLPRREHPSARHLLDDGELLHLVGDGLAIERYEEGWLATGRHEALLVARKSAAGAGTL